MPKRRKGDVREVATTVGSAALAAPALSVPFLWIAFSLGMRLVAGAVRRAQEAGQSGPTVSSFTETVRSAGRKVPKRALPSVARGAISLVTAFGLIGIWVGVPWLAGKGPDGVLVAIRIAEHQHLIPLFCALTCWRILRGPKGERAVLEPLVDFIVKPSSQPRLAAAGAPCLVVLVLFVFVMPRAVWAPWGSFEAATGALPRATGDAIFDMRRDLVSEQVRAVLDCAAEEQGDLGWEYTVSDGERRGTLAVDITRSPQGASTRADVSALAIALHNQLSRGVETLSIQRRPNFAALVIDRTRVSRSRPLRKTAPMARAAGVGPEVLPLDDTVEQIGLRCGARAF